MPSEANLVVIQSTDEARSATKSQERDVIFPQLSQKQMAKDDIYDGFKKWRVWLMLAYQDIKLRYHRSVIGPFWITLSMAITVYSMGFLYSHLFHIELSHYYPFLVSSMLSWSLISTAINELTETFMSSNSLIKQIKLPYSLYIHRVITRNLIIFFHNMIVMIPIFIIFHATAKITFNTLLLIPGLCFIYINGLCYGLTLGILGARYRDISQIIKSLIQVIFFVTPVMWNASVIPLKYHYLLYLNPFYSFLELIRAPIQGNAPLVANYLIVTVVTLIGLMISSFMFTRYRARIIYWL